MVKERGLGGDTEGKKPAQTASIRSGRFVDRKYHQTEQITLSTEGNCKHLECLDEKNYQDRVGSWEQDMRGQNQTFSIE